MSDLYSPDLDDSIIPLGYITTYILENDKNGNNQLQGLNFEDRIKFIWRALNDEEELQEALDIEKLWERRSLRKSWAEAERLRKIGNSKYSGGQWTEALSCYNTALSFLPQDIKDPVKNILPQLRANRALALHQLGHHQAALRDIKAALEGGYPEHARYKLYARQAACFRCLGQEKVAEVCWDRARGAASSLEGEERLRAEMFIEQRHGERDRGMEVREERAASIMSSHEVTNPHPLYPAFTDKIR